MAKTVKELERAMSIGDNCADCCFVSNLICVPCCNSSYLANTAGDLQVSSDLAAGHGEIEGLPESHFEKEKKNLAKKISACSDAFDCISRKVSEAKSIISSRSGGSSFVSKNLFTATMCCCCAVVSSVPVNVDPVPGMTMDRDCDKPKREHVVVPMFPCGLGNVGNYGLFSSDSTRDKAFSDMKGGCCQKIRGFLFNLKRAGALSCCSLKSFFYRVGGTVIPGSCFGIWCCCASDLFRSLFENKKGFGRVRFGDDEAEPDNIEMGNVQFPAYIFSLQEKTVKTESVGTETQCFERSEEEVLRDENLDNDVNEETLKREALKIATVKTEVKHKEPAATQDQDGAQKAVAVCDKVRIKRKPNVRKNEAAVEQVEAVVEQVMERGYNEMAVDVGDLETMVKVSDDDLTDSAGGATSFLASTAADSRAASGAGNKSSSVLMRPGHSSQEENTEPKEVLPSLDISREDENEQNPLRIKDMNKKSVIDFIKSLDPQDIDEMRTIIGNVCLGSPDMPATSGIAQTAAQFLQGFGRDGEESNFSFA